LVFLIEEAGRIVETSIDIPNSLHQVLIKSSSTISKNYELKEIKTINILEWREYDGKARAIHPQYVYGKKQKKLRYLAQARTSMFRRSN
jgi:hypothetical protein